MAVNFSAFQLQQYDIVTRIAKVLEETQMIAEDLELEITETTVMENLERMTNIIKQLKSMGIKIAIDDFGTGYSSLNVLKHLPVDTLKIDKSFVQDLTDDPNDAKLCQGIIMLGKAFKLEVLAEGVETIKQLNFLHSLGCDRAQGYLISLPLSSEILEEILLKSQLLIPSAKTVNQPCQDLPIIVSDSEQQLKSSISTSKTHLGLLKAEIDGQQPQHFQNYLHLKQEIQFSTTRERIVMDVAQKIRQSFKLDDILNTTVSEVRHLLNSDRVFLYQFDEHWVGKVVVESVASVEFSILGEWIDEPCFRNHYIEYYRQGGLKAIDDVEQATIAECHRELLKRYQVKANLVLPVVYLDKLWGLLIVHDCHYPRKWLEHEITLLSQIAIQAAIAIHQGELYEQLELANLQLRQFSYIDGLTQVANRNHFDIYLQQQWRQLTRSRNNLSLIFGDLDYFKGYNDTYGHQAGDRCLQQVTQVIKTLIRRPADLVARYGGEEFAVVLPDTPLPEASYLAEQIRQQVKHLTIPHLKSAYQCVTLSLGVASLVPTAVLSPKVLINAVDEALYQAKASGRDRVVSKLL